jgi:hypothetical protein
MKCPTCTFSFSDLRDICPQCFEDVREFKRASGIPITHPHATLDELRSYLSKQPKARIQPQISAPSQTPPKKESSSKIAQTVIAEVDPPKAKAPEQVVGSGTIQQIPSKPSQTPPLSFPDFHLFESSAVQSAQLLRPADESVQLLLMGTVANITSEVPPPPPLPLLDQLFQNADIELLHIHDDFEISFSQKSTPLKNELITLYFDLALEFLNEERGYTEESYVEAPRAEETKIALSENVENALARLAPLENAPRLSDFITRNLKKGGHHVPHDEVETSWASRGIALMVDSLTSALVTFIIATSALITRYPETQYRLTLFRLPYFTDLVQIFFLTIAYFPLTLILLQAISLLATHHTLGTYLTRSTLIQYDGGPPSSELLVVRAINYPLCLIFGWILLFRGKAFLDVVSKTYCIRRHQKKEDNSSSSPLTRLHPLTSRRGPRSLSNDILSREELTEKSI